MQSVVVRCIYVRVSLVEHTQTSLKLSRITTNQEVPGMLCNIVIDLPLAN